MQGICHGLLVRFCLQCLVHVVYRRFGFNLGLKISEVLLKRAILEAFREVPMQLLDLLIDSLQLNMHFMRTGLVFEHFAQLLHRDLIGEEVLQVSLGYLVVKETLDLLEG